MGVRGIVYICLPSGNGATFPSNGSDILVKCNVTLLSWTAYHFVRSRASLLKFPTSSNSTSSSFSKAVRICRSERYGNSEEKAFMLLYVHALPSWILRPLAAFFSHQKETGQPVCSVEQERRSVTFVRYPGLKIWYRHEEQEATEI